MKSTIFVTQQDNNTHFERKLPTWRNGWCEIKRTVRFETDPSGHRWGYITVNGKKVYVYGEDNYFEIR